MEIGGYIELERNFLPMLHENAIKLNCGRNALAYLIRARGIKCIWMPKFNCDSCSAAAEKLGCEIKYYSVGFDFKPVSIEAQAGEWVMVVNFYGQLSDEYLSELSSRYNIIVDNAQAYFRKPLQGVDTTYTCRKFFGVSDGAMLYTDAVLEEELPLDESFERMHFLLGRFERSASEFYSEYAENNELFYNEDIKRMSKLTENLLRGIDYERVKEKRTENFAYLHEMLGALNRLELTVPEGAFMYPLYIENGAEIRKKLQKQKIYIPTLWADVFELCNDTETEYKMAENILPLPVDQRYGKAEMDIMIKAIFELLGKTDKE